MITDKNIGLKATIQVIITITFDTMTYTIIYVYIIALVCRNFMLALAACRWLCTSNLSRVVYVHAYSLGTSLQVAAEPKSH